MIKKSILIVDDEESYLNSMKRSLKLSSIWDEISLTCVNSVDNAIKEINVLKFDIVLVDMNMPIRSGKELISILLKSEHIPFIIIITGNSSISEAISYLKSGVYDYISKPILMDELVTKLTHIFTIIENKLKINILEKQVSILTPKKEFIAYSSSMSNVHKLIKSAQNSDFPVLILGESGTGKEVVADQIHFGSSRKNEPFIKINTAGIVPTLLESEMFGYEKGAFTGAYTSKQGKFELANNGTLFLDEIGEMDISLQVKLLRVLQDGVFERVGGVNKIFSDSRVISATNKILEDRIERGEFRKDLFYRLNIITIEIPPLKDRTDDIPLLIKLFLSNYNNKYKRDVKIDLNVIKHLQSCAYPGNIRELENIIARAFAVCENDLIKISDLNINTNNTSETPKLDSNNSFELSNNLDILEEKLIVESLKRNKYNKIKSATELGISRRQLYYKMSKYNIL